MAETITIIDDRTGKKVTVPVTDGVFASSALRELDPDLRMYDPAFLSTAACKSAITYLVGIRFQDNLYGSVQNWQISCNFAS